MSANSITTNNVATSPITSPIRGEKTPVRPTTPPPWLVMDTSSAMLSKSQNGEAPSSLSNVSPEQSQAPDSASLEPASCKITLKDGNAVSDDPLMQMTTPSGPPPPPPPAGAVMVETVPAIDSSSKITPTTENHRPDCSGQSQPPNSRLTIRIPTSIRNSTMTVGNNQSGTNSTSSSPNIPPTKLPPLSGPAHRLAQKLEYARIGATANPYYLALGNSVRSATAWIRDGRANILVAKDAAKSVTEALAAHAADPTVVAAPDMPSRVPCSIIGTISMEQCFLRADGNFKGFNPALTWQKKFSQTTLSFALGPPSCAYPMLVKDFHTGIATFDSILPKNANLKSGQYAQGLPNKHLRLRHAIFAPRSRNGDADIVDGSDTALPAEFTIYQWPTYSTEAADALAAIVDSHVARPLPAYDLRGDLIPPTQYSAALRGATVLVSYNVSHYSITDKRMNGTETTKQQLCLDVDYIRVLIPPPHTSTAKRSAVHLTDPHSHTAKKMRQA